MADDSSTETQIEVISVKKPSADARMHEHGCGGDSDVVEGNENAPHVGMVFKTYEEVYEFYNEYAQRIGFGIKVRSSRYNEDGCQQFSLACCKEGKEKVCMYRLRVSAKTNCQARIKARKLWVDGLFHLVEVKLEHNHPVNPLMARFFRSNKKLLDRNNKHLECNDEDGIEPNSSYTMQAEEHENPSLVEGECRSHTERVRRLGLGKGDVEVILQYFIRMKSKNSNFYYTIDVDEDGRMRNVFWADGTCRAACQYFGDVVSLDTTYLTNNYDTPFAPFVGVNHHGQSVLLGCSLLAVETVETYISLFKAWLSCMAERHPHAIITDHCKGIQEAVVNVFPRAHHRLCLWQVMKRIPEKLAGIAECKAITRTLKNVVYDSLRADEFEVNWRKMVEEYELQDNEWLKSLYENRHLWVPVFVRDTFWAGMSTIRRGESLSSFFDGHMHANTSLKQFLSMYETVLQSKYEMEARADFDSFDKHPKLISQLSMEEQLSKIYTLNMFKKFQEEIKALMYCHPMRTIDGPISTFEVKERVRMKDDKRMEHRYYKVLYNANDVEVQCLCCSFQYSGILCRHALSVLNFHDVDDIPPRYILDRWKKDFKRLHALACSIGDSMAIGSMERYDDLWKHCVELAEVGSISDEKYKLVLKILQEAKEKLLGNYPFRVSQPKTVPCETRTCDPNRLIAHCSTAVVTANGNRKLANELGTHVDSEMSCPAQKRKRGRPPKVGKESLVEKTINTAKKKVSQGKSPVDKQSVVFPFTPTTPYFDSPIGTQGIANFKEQVYPTNLLIGSYRGVQVNPQHIIGYQPGMQWSIKPTLQELQRTKEPPGSNIG